MGGNSRLYGGPEDGVEVDVAWPPAPQLRRSFEGEIVVYEKTDETTEDGRMRWDYVGRDGTVEDPPEPFEPTPNDE